MQAAGTEPTLIWSPAGKPVSIHIPSNVLTHVRPPRAAAESERVPERGGVLLGVARQMGDRWLIAVEGAVEVRGRNELGESWRPEPRALYSAFRKKWGESSGVVGFWRTHTRPGLYLDDKDFRLFRDSFSAPSNIALAVTPDNAGFFFWEEGEVQRSHPYEILSVPAAPDGGAEPPPVVIRKFNEGWRPNKTWLAVPVVAGVVLGLLWNPDPLRRRARSVDLSEIPDSEAAGEPRAVFSPPPLPESQPDTPFIPPQEEGSITTRARTNPAAEAPRAPLRRLIPPPPRITAAEPVMDLEAPTIAAVRSERLVIPHREEQLVQAVMEPSKPSAVRRVVGSIPGLGFLKRRKADEKAEAYTPPKIVRQIRPTSPGGLAEEVPVRIRVLLNADGKIEKTELLTRKVEPAVAKAAVEAAQNWRFEPARMGEKAVASELVVQFRFPAAAPAGGGGGSAE